MDNVKQLLLLDIGGATGTWQTEDDCAARRRLTDSTSDWAWLYVRFLFLGLRHCSLSVSDYAINENEGIKKLRSVDHSHSIHFDSIRIDWIIRHFQSRRFTQLSMLTFALAERLSHDNSPLFLTLIAFCVVVVYGVGVIDFVVVFKQIYVCWNMFALSFGEYRVIICFWNKQPTKVQSK